MKNQLLGRQTVTRIKAFLLVYFVGWFFLYPCVYLIYMYIGMNYVQRKWEYILCMEQQFLGQEDNKAFLVPGLKS